MPLRSIRPEQLDPEDAERDAFDRVADLTGLRVLEVGAGDGRLTWRLARDAAFVHGIDTDAEKIAKARADTPRALSHRIRLSVLSALELDEPPGTYEAAVLAWSL
jgi:2-polyprenyl-3-methyl-5-hydroxy-6-metoxy-1,4-benzoquinol methylase